MVNATRALSAIILEPSLLYNFLFLSKKKTNNPAAIRLLPSEKEWFFTTKYKRFAAFSIMLGYNNLKEGEKMGRLVAEYYYIYQDDRIKNNYVRTPKQRYDSISEVFPNIHNRVPQHMIASYLGISPIHLSRLKKIWNRKTINICYRLLLAKWPFFALQSKWILIKARAEENQK